MNYDEVYAFLDQIGAPASHDEGEWVMSNCPLAPYADEHSGAYDSTPSFGVHVEDHGMSFYNCFTCKSKGPVSDLAKQLGRYRDEQKLTDLGRALERGAAFLAAETAFQDWDNEEDHTTKQKGLIPEGRFSEAEAFAEYPSFVTEPRAVAYLRRRRVSFAAAVALGLRYDAKQYRILFPVYYDFRSRRGDWHSVLVGFTGRTIRNKRYIEYRNSLEKGSYPKVRDYKGLDKENVILSRKRRASVSIRSIGLQSTHGKRIGHGDGNAQAAVSSSPGIARQARQRGNSFVIVVEGLFALAHLQSIAPDLEHVALLGSTVTPGKVQRLLERGQSLYWLLDNDEAGWSGMWGTKDPKTGKRRKNGGLHKIGHDLPQFIIPYPKLDKPVQRADGSWKTHKEDPDELTRAELDYGIKNAEVYVHRGR